jgi:hypothetical protein
MRGQGATGWNDTKRREATWVVVAGYGYFAPGRVAMDEQRERVMTAAAHRRLLAFPGSTGRRSSSLSRRHFLSDLLRAIEARARQMQACGTTIAVLRKTTACSGHQ